MASSVARFYEFGYGSYSNFLEPATWNCVLLLYDLYNNAVDRSEHTASNNKKIREL
jgi:hypothetical protein